MREIFEMRRLLESSAAASTAAILDDRIDDVLKRSFQKARKAYGKNDGGLMIEANMAFRDAWLDAVQNSRLRITIRRFADYAQQARLRTLTDHPTQKIVVDGMQAMLQGFLERDTKRIKLATQDFIARAEQRYFALLEGEE